MNWAWMDMYGNGYMNWIGDDDESIWIDMKYF